MYKFAISLYLNVLCEWKLKLQSAMLPLNSIPLLSETVTNDLQKKYFTISSFHLSIWQTMFCTALAVARHREVCF